MLEINNSNKKKFYSKQIFNQFSNSEIKFYILIFSIDNYYIFAADYNSSKEYTYSIQEICIYIKRGNFHKLSFFSWLMVR
ncbi:hypothetical protein DLK05_06010 [Ancylomarina longa]|uniref:Uncharacterized protein n=1 Tax=Ancylomarina longa TaxID=2487017 RepID=A0A434AWY0_9BACT|nr:hypothetical protein DLK05_06010 [Ancylomarina longa]